MRDYTLKTFLTDLLILLEIGVIVTATIVLTMILFTLQAVSNTLTEFAVGLFDVIV